MSPWAGLGDAAAAFAGAKQGAERQQAELKRAAALESEYQSRQRTRDFQIELAGGIARERDTERAMQKEAMQLEGSREQQILARRSVSEREGALRWMEDPDVTPEMLERQFDDWEAQDQLKDLMAETEALEGYAAGIGSDPETGEEGPQMEAVQGFLDSFKAGDTDFSTAATEIKEVGRRMHVEQRAGAQRLASIEKAEEMILRYKPESTGLDEREENYDEMVDILAQISNGVTMVKSADKDKGMVPKGYNALLGELEVLLNPNLAAAVEARQARKRDEQIEMEQSSPIVYEELQRKFGPTVNQRQFGEAKQALDLGGLSGLRRHLGLGFSAEAEQLRGAGYEGGMGGAFTPQIQEFKENPFEALDPKKPRKLSQLKGEARAAAMQSVWGAIDQIDTSLKDKELEAAVVKRAREVGLVGTFEEIMSALEENPKAKKGGSGGYSDSGLMEIGIQ